VDSKELGHFAIASSLVFIALGIIDFSFSSSLIHEDQVKEADYRAVLNINLLILSYVYDQSKLFSLTLVLSPILFFNAFNNVHIAGLKKELKFDQIAKIDFFAALISFAVFIIALKMNGGIWSLLFAFIFRYLIISASLIMSRHTYCSFGLSQNTYLIKKHFNYGKYILGEKGLSNVLSYADIFLVGSFLGVSSLGIYDVLKKLILRPVIMLYTAIENIVFPLLSQHKNDKGKYKSIYKQFLAITNVFFIPLLLLVFIFAEYLVLLLPESYTLSGSIVKALSILCISILIFNPTDILLYSQGKTKLFMKWMLGYTLPLLAIMFFAVQINIETFIYALAVSYLSLYALAYFVLFRSHDSISIDLYFNPILISACLLILILLIERFASGLGAVLLSAVMVIGISVLLLKFSFKKDLITSEPL